MSQRLVTQPDSNCLLVAIKVNSSWILRSKPKHKAHLRFFCFPYAGAGASVFASWADLMPPEVELCAVQLPRRETRLREKPFVRLPSLVRAVRESLRPYLHNPSAFFGHTMGALISFELSRELRRTLWRWFRMRTWKASGASFPRPLRAAWPSQRPISKRASTCRSISSPPPRSSRAQKPPRCTRDRSWASIASRRATKPSRPSPVSGKSCSASSRSAFTATFSSWAASRYCQRRWSRACAPRSKPSCRCATFSKSRLSPSWRTRSSRKRIDNRAQSSKNRPQ